ncbi:MAG TPA: hypothetical protein PKH31_02760 [Candidatus Sumerlaeota bacterium]|nr:hypothetical protein [Candidatus Sumerlaeota bacterium]
MNLGGTEKAKGIGKRGTLSRILPLFLILMALLPGLARAELRVSVKRMGQSTNSPYIWMRVTVENPDGNRLGFRLFGNGSYGRSSGETQIEGQELGPGEERTYDVPMLGMTEYRGGGSYYSGGFFRCQDSTGRMAVGNDSASDLKTFLNIAPVSQWASEQQIQDFSDAVEHPEKKQQGPPEPEFAGPVLGSSAPYPGAAGVPPGSTKKSNFISQVEPGQLPDNWLCYTPFTAVMVSSDAYKTIPAEARTALTRWVNSGGRLVVYGASETRREECLLGRIEYRMGPVLTALDRIPKEWEMPGGNPQSSPLDWTRSGGMGGADGFPFLVQLDALGRSGGLLLATIFCIVAGPANYFYWRRKNRIRMLMLSLPAFSIAFCLLITGYFLATKGFSRKGGTFSISILDEGSDSALTFSRHLLFSGLYPLGGFSFDSETAFVPMESSGDQAYKMALQNRQRQLTDGLFIPQVPFHYYTVTPWSTRERLVYKAAEKTVENGFETPLQGVVVYDQGVYVAGAVPKGGKATLERLEGEAAKNVLDRFLNPEEKSYLENKRSLYEPVERLSGRQVQHYIVFFDGKLPTEQAGLDIKEGRHRHALIGAFGPQSGEKAVNSVPKNTPSGFASGTPDSQK